MDITNYHFVWEWPWAKIAQEKGNLLFLLNDKQF